MIATKKKPLGQLQGRIRYMQAQRKAREESSLQASAQVQTKPVSITDQIHQCLSQTGVHRGGFEILYLVAVEKHGFHLQVSTTKERYLCLTFDKSEGVFLHYLKVSKNNKVEKKQSWLLSDLTLLELPSESEILLRFDQDYSWMMNSPVERDESAWVILQCCESLCSIPSSSLFDDKPIIHRINVDHLISSFPQLQKHFNKLLSSSKNRSTSVVTDQHQFISDEETAAENLLKELNWQDLSAKQLENDISKLADNLNTETLECLLQWEDIAKSMISTPTSTTTSTANMTAEQIFAEKPKPESNELKTEQESSNRSLLAALDCVEWEIIGTMEWIDSHLKHLSGIYTSLVAIEDKSMKLESLWVNSRMLLLSIGTLIECSVLKPPSEAILNNPEEILNRCMDPHASSIATTLNPLIQAGCELKKLIQMEIEPAVTTAIDMYGDVHSDKTECVSNDRDGKNKFKSVFDNTASSLSVRADAQVHDNLVEYVHDMRNLPSVLQQQAKLRSLAFQVCQVVGDFLYNSFTSIVGGCVGVYVLANPQQKKIFVMISPDLSPAFIILLAPLSMAYWEIVDLGKLHQALLQHALHITQKLLHDRLLDWSLVMKMMLDLGLDELGISELRAAYADSVLTLFSDAAKQYFYSLKAGTVVTKHPETIQSVQSFSSAIVPVDEHESSRNLAGGNNTQSNTGVAFVVDVCRSLAVSGSKNLVPAAYSLLVCLCQWINVIAKESFVLQSMLSSASEKNGVVVNNSVNVVPNSAIRSASNDDDDDDDDVDTISIISDSKKATKKRGIMTLRKKDADSVSESKELGMDGVKSVDSLLRSIFQSFERKIRKFVASRNFINGYNCLQCNAVIRDCLKWLDQCCLGLSTVESLAARLYLTNLMMELQFQISQRLAEFVDQQVDWIKSFRVSAKRSGFLDPVLKFPVILSLIRHNCFDRLDSQFSISSLDGAEGGGSSNVNSEAEIVIQKLANAINHCIENVATTDKKYEHLVRLENYRFLYEVLRGEKISCLSRFVAQCRTSYETSLVVYSNWMINYQMEDLSQFIVRLVEVRQRVGVNDVGIYLPKSAYEALISQKVTRRQMSSAIEEITSRLKKHVSIYPQLPGLRLLVWKKIRQLIEVLWSSLDKNSVECYGKRLPVSNQEFMTIIQENEERLQKYT